jgi:hypothetical protein
MAKLLPAIVLGFAQLSISVALLLAPATQPAHAQTCASNCGSRPIQFTPGQPIRLVMVNHTPNRVQVEQVFETDPISLLPGQELEIDPNFGTEPNVSIVFWNEAAAPVQAILTQPDTTTLRIEVRPGARPPGDRSVYIQNDGRVVVF